MNPKLKLWIEFVFDAACFLVICILWAHTDFPNWTFFLFAILSIMGASNALAKWNQL